MIFRLEYKNRKGLQARLDITTPGSSIVKEIEGAGNPFILSYKGDKSDKSFNFLTSSAEINIYETPEFNIDKLKTSNETQIKVDYFIDDQLSWTGFVIPDFFSREIGGAGVVSMTASDRVSTLKGVTLSDLPAMVQIRDLAVRCLARTGLDLPLKTMADFRATDLGFNQYFRSEISSQRLYDSKGRSISCYDILKSILVASGSTLRQRGGEWHIINKLQHEAGVGRVYSTENTSVDYVESVHNFNEIVKGARRTIIPVAGSVGIYHEYGGGKLHPDNYDFSQGLTGWTPVGGFVAGIGNQSVNGYKIQSGVYVPDYGEAGLNHLKNANPYQRNVNPIYLESAPISVPYSGSGAVNIEFDINGVGPMLTTQAVMRIAIVAQKGSEILTLHHGGSFNPMPSANPPVFERRFKRGFTSSDFTAGVDTQSMRVSGTLESGELEGWELKVRIYGGGSSNTILINAASIHMKSSQETPRGAIYKRDQGADFTKTHDVETTIFGDYLTTGKDGYFYDYPIDDTSSIHNPYTGISSLWTTPYFPTETDSLPLLQHVVRQQARMFSVAHDLISGEIEMERFNPLSIFVDCNGKRYVVVSATFDFLRSNVKVDLEEIAYENLTVRDFIYSYFGEGESGISSVGGISTGTGGGGSGGGMTPDQIAILSEVQDLAHDHENKEVLDQVTQEVVDNALREMIISTDTETELTDENYLSSLRVLAEILKNNETLKDQFLSKIDPDTAKGLIKFLAGLETDGFVSGIYTGSGGGIDRHGNAEFQSLTVRSSMRVLEIIINRLSAIEGDQVLTESDTIESIVDLGDGTYGLHLREKWEGYFTGQVENNVIRGMVNTLASGGKDYYTSWMRINSVNAPLNYIEVALYPDDETPDGINYPPVELMKIARWGNQTDEKRQSCIYISSTEGRITHLTGVTKPIIDAGNYGSTFGSLPEFLKSMGLPIGEDEEGVYIKTLVAQNIIRFDHQGNPMPTFVDRGEFDIDEDYYSGAVNPDTGVYETSDVWYLGCKWRCMTNLTKSIPRWNNTDWAMIEGNPEFTVEFMETENIFDPDNFNATLTILAKLHNQDVTADIRDTDIVWTRYSEDLNGVERVSSDNAWAQRHAGAGKSISLTADDADFLGYVPRALRFTATVTLRDGITGQANIEYR